MSKNKTQDYNLRDFIWEQEEFKFEPKVNRHKKFLKAKKRQLEKEKYVDERKRNLINNYLNDVEVIKNEHDRYISKLEESLLQDYYDQDDDEDYKGYRIK